MRAGDIINQALTADEITDNSLLAVLKTGSGLRYVSIKTLTVQGAQKINIFQLSGGMQVDAIAGVIMAVSALTSCTDIHFDLWDGTTSFPITKVTTADLSGLGVGTTFVKTDVKTTAITLIDGAGGAITETSGKTALSDFLMTPKTGVTTYIRFGYTAGAAINVTIAFSVYVTAGNSNKLIPV